MTSSEKQGNYWNENTVNILRKYIRSLLFEQSLSQLDVRSALITEVAKTPDDLPSGYYVATQRSDLGIDVMITDKHGEPVPGARAIHGDFAAYAGGHQGGPTLNAYVVSGAGATQGWGPMLYDVMMELAHEDGGRGLAPDRGIVSTDAEKVWKYYLEKRPDITHKQLDFPVGHDYHITPTQSDDSGVQMQFDGIYDKNPKIAEKARKNYLASPLSKVYFTHGTPTLDALYALGKWVDLE